MTNKQEKEFYEEQRIKGIPYVRQIQIGLWEIFDGTNTVMTGDGGYMEFNEALKKAVNEEIKKIKLDIINSSKKFGNETHG